MSPINARTASRVAPMPLRLRFEGCILLGVPDSPRIWTIMSEFIGNDGQSYFRSTRTLEGLKEIGAIGAIGAIEK